MLSVEVAEGTAAVVLDQARRAGLSVDEYIRRLLLDSLAQHASVIDERYYLDAEAERLAS